MAKKNGKVIVDSRGDVKLRRASGHHSPIGSVKKVGGAYVACGLPKGVSSKPHCTLKKTKAAAVLHVVRDWQRWVGVGRGKTDY